MSDWNEWKNLKSPSFDERKIQVSFSAFPPDLRCDSIPLPTRPLPPVTKTTDCAIGRIKKVNSLMGMDFPGFEKERSDLLLRTLVIEWIFKFVKKILHPHIENIGIIFIVKDLASNNTNGMTSNTK